MPLIDWNNDGKIDPVDIGISIAAEDDDGDGVETPPSETPKKPAVGCLTTIMTFSGILAVVAVCLWVAL